MKYCSVSRRMFLQGVGASLAIPFLPSLALGQSVQESPFFIMIATRESLDRFRTWPRNKSIAYDQVDADTKIRRLMDIATVEGQLSEHLDASWNPYLDKMNLFTHLSLYSRSNLHSSIVMGCADNRQEQNTFYSIDYLIQEHLKQQGYQSTMDHIVVNFNRTLFPDYTKSFWMGSSQEQNVPDNPRQLEQLIADAMGNTVPVTPTQTPKQKIVDLVVQDFNRLMNNRNISSVDKNRLSDALDMWNDIGNSSPVVQAGECSMTANPNSTNLSVQQRYAVDVLVASIACGLTRVVNHGIIPVGNDVGDTRYETEVVNHEWAHNGGPSSYGKFRSDIVKYYAEKLSSVTGMDGKPLMESGALFWSQEYSGFGLHQHHGRTVLTLGNAGGRLKTGYQVNAGNAPFQRAHITMMKAFGLSDAQIERKGEVGFGEYESSNVSSGGFSDTEVEWEASTGNNQWDPDFTFNFGPKVSQFTTSNIEKRKAFTGFLL